MEWAGSVIASGVKSYTGFTPAFCGIWAERFLFGFFSFLKSCLHTENTERSEFCFTSICHNFYLDQKDFIPNLIYSFEHFCSPDPVLDCSSISFLQC